MLYKDVLTLIKRAQFPGGLPGEYPGSLPSAQGELAAYTWFTPHDEDRPKNQNTFWPAIGEYLSNTTPQQYARNAATAAVTAPFSIANGMLSVSTSLANLGAKGISEGLQAVGVDPSVYDAQKGVRQVTTAMHDMIKWVPEQVAKKLQAQRGVYEGTMNTGTGLTETIATPSIAAGAVKSKAALKAAQKGHQLIGQLPQKIQSGVAAVSPMTVKGSEMAIDSSISKFAPVH